MPSYKLTYFDIRGRAELSRCVFAAAGVQFEDVRVTDWANDKAKTKYGQLPELSVDGKVLAQSNSIARYLAREFNLAGKNNWEQGQVDQYVEMANDLFEQLVKVIFEKDEAKKKELEKTLNEETLPKFMGYFEKDLGSSGDFMVGSALTLADLAVQNTFDNFLSKDPAALDKFPKLKAHRARVHGAPKLCDYIKNRKKADI